MIHGWPWLLWERPSSQLRCARAPKWNWGVGYALLCRRGIGERLLVASLEQTSHTKPIRKQKFSQCRPNSTPGGQIGILCNYIDCVPPSRNERLSLAEICYGT